MNGIPMGDSPYDNDRAIDNVVFLYKKPTAELCSLKCGLMSIQNQIFLGKPRGSSSAFPSPSVPVPSDSSAHDHSTICFPPLKSQTIDQKKPNVGFGNLIWEMSPLMAGVELGEL